MARTKLKNTENAETTEVQVSEETQKKIVIDSEIKQAVDTLSAKIDLVETIEVLQNRIDNLNIVTTKQTPIKSNNSIGNFFNTLFASNSGNSSMRMIFFVWAIGTWTIWAGMSLYKGELQPISAELAAVLAALGAAKAGQKFGESRMSSME